MMYEATINFELRDGVDILDLIGDQKIDVHRLHLTGFTSEGHVASEMEMMWGGTVDWNDEAKARIAEATREIARRLEVDESTANRLWEWMSYVYEAMAANGLCAWPGGEQSVRVIPETLEFIRSRPAPCPKESDGRYVSAE
jgi:hypothetical protein